MSFSNPLNTLLLTPILYLVYKIIFPSRPVSSKTLPSEYNPEVYNWLPASHPPTICYKRFGPKELSKYDGKGVGAEGGRILLAIMRIGRDGKLPLGKVERTVFDVSNGRNFYGPGTYDPRFPDVISGSAYCIHLLFMVMTLTACRWYVW